MNKSDIYIIFIAHVNIKKWLNIPSRYEIRILVGLYQFRYPSVTGVIHFQ